MTTRAFPQLILLLPLTCLVGCVPVEYDETGASCGEGHLCSEPAFTCVAGRCEPAGSSEQGSTSRTGRLNTFEGGSDGAPLLVDGSGLSAGDYPFSEVRVATGGEAVFDRSRAFTGSMSARLANISGQRTFLSWRVPPAAGRLCAQLHLFLGGSPPETVHLVEFASDHALLAAVVLHPDGTWGVASGDARSAPALAGVPVALRSWVRFETCIEDDGVEARLFNGPLTATSSGTVRTDWSPGRGVASELRLGLGWGTAGSPLWLDDVAVTR